LLFFVCGGPNADPASVADQATLESKKKQFEQLQQMLHKQKQKQK